jgi:hypothetical protein
MLKGERLSGFDYGCEAAVLTGSYKLAWFEFDWGSAMGASYILSYSHDG